MNEKPARQTINTCINYKLHDDDDEYIFNVSVWIQWEMFLFFFVSFRFIGKPLPILNWYRNEQLIRRQIFHILSEKNHTLQSELHLTPIQADDHNCWFKCLSSNDNQTFLNVKILMKVNSKFIDCFFLNFSCSNYLIFVVPFIHNKAKPKRVEITAYPSSSSSNFYNKNQTSTTPTKPSFISGQEIIIRCRSYGSRPPANHSWFMMPGHRPIPVLE